MARRLLSVLLWNALPLVSVGFQPSPLRTTAHSTLSQARSFPAVPSKAEYNRFPSKIASTADGQADEAVQVDWDALLKYHVAIATQMTLFAGSLTALDALVDLTGVNVPFPVVGALFYVLSLKSRVFNPLNNDRPDRSKAVDGEASAGFRDRTMPSWTPPGVVFPIVWILINAPLRAYSSAVVYETTHQFMNPAILAFLFHLSVGDVWNTINNTESRYGASVMAVLCVLASVLYAAYQYSLVNPLAGNLLGLTAVWLSVATCLVTATWKVNPDPETGEPYPLYPTVEDDTETSFIWFQ